MPEEGITLREREQFMNQDEIFEIARLFVQKGVTKIRLTGGEPTVKKDFREIIKRLSTLGVDLGITTNGVMLDQFFEDLKYSNVKSINISLDTLQKDRYYQITRRDYFERVISNIHMAIKLGFNVKVNVVVIRGVNDDEILNFVEFTRNIPITVRFIEYMPFDGNNWSLEKKVSFQEMIEKIHNGFPDDEINRVVGGGNDTDKKYKIAGYNGFFGVISSVTNPFCDTCNRIRLTADGKLKNCLFSQEEVDLLTPLRLGFKIDELIYGHVKEKLKRHGGVNFFDVKNQNNNRSMVRIGG
jgi:cyclic pyranopterin phosphate synthase